ncbi:unnamed protein product [Lactuca saligna]|uniref:non-specific serine/threonine protein kinase n=1 Tax=Lactuca saligna TaxID=75948 RepID=A0AA35Z7G9_LACSI|nr:unnamed protein product [Lactuca saligna]
MRFQIRISFEYGVPYKPSSFLLDEIGDKHTQLPGKLLGQGNFAKVYHGRNLETGMSVAVKVINKDKVMKVGLIDQIKREISVMKLVKHPNVVQLYEVMATKTKIYFILEYLKGGELYDKVATGRLKEATARKYFQQLITAINFCHNQGVYHRDLKPENLLLDEDGNLKVSDFGLSALVDTKWEEDGLLHTSCGTPAYVAPEVIYQKGYDGEKADIWSCGVILFVLLSGFLPFQDSNLMVMYRKITRAEFKFPNWFPSEARKLVSKILDPNPKTRISIAKIMENSWFKKGFVSEGSFGETIKDFRFLGKPDDLNAFDIISLSPGFDLSGLFNDDAIDEKEVKFMSKMSFVTIVLKLEEIAKISMLKVMKNDGGLLKMEGLNDGKNRVLDIHFEIFEIAHDVHIIVAKRLGGNKFEFWEIVNEHIKPTLVDS